MAEAGLVPGSFDHVLLDAPCSALGLRPRLLLSWDLNQLQQLAGYQRALLHSAVHMLKPGGTMVYCTCTINPGGDYWEGRVGPEGLNEKGEPKVMTRLARCDSVC
jgi:hypothetical protein